jgi:hypothetical protein
MSLAAALAEIDRVEAILRSRYHYAHPVFNHLASAREHLQGLAEEPAPAQVPESEAVFPPAAPPTPEPEAEPESAEEEGEPATEGQPPARRARRGR